MTSLPTVLIVDDDPDIRSLLRAALAGEGYGVRVAANGVEALADLDHERPDLILLDLMMPVMDGVQFYERFRARENGGARVPVVLISAGHGLSQTAHAMGTDGYVPKPFDLDRLLDEVARFVH